MPARSKRIALYLPSLRGGGAERVMVNLARGFAERGVKVDMVLAKAEGPYLDDMSPKVRVVDLGAKRVLYSLPGLFRYLKREKPAVLLSAMNRANVVSLWAKRLSGVKTRVVVAAHNMLLQSSVNAGSIWGRIMPILVKWFYPWAEAVVAVSQGVANDLIQAAGICREKITVIYNPVITSEIYVQAEEPVNHPWFKASEPPVIISVGRLAKAKDFSTLIRAFALMREESPARLMILGEGGQRQELEAIVKELGLEKEVDMPGFVENPYKYVKQAKVFALSSRWEGFGNVLVEALACGTPIVSTDCPTGPSEILEGGKWGKLVPVGDPEALARGILETLDSPPKSEDLQKRAKAFSLEAILPQYLEVLGIKESE